MKVRFLEAAITELEALLTIMTWNLKVLVAALETKLNLRSYASSAILRHGLLKLKTLESACCINFLTNYSIRLKRTTFWLLPWLTNIGNPTIGRSV